MILSAIDIGSNSIHQVVVETDREKPFRVLASAKEMVRLGRSAARDRRLSPAAMNRAIEALQKFRANAESHGAREILTTATSAVREATNQQEFIERVTKETGLHVELLSGIEEARMIALAVAMRMPQSNNCRALAIDIGGGSTELPVTQNGEPAVLISLKLGSVRLTEQLGASDPPSEKTLRRLRAELRAVIAQRAPEIKTVGFDVCYGTSGTIAALERVALQRHLKNPTAPGRAAKRSEASLSLKELRALNEELARLPLAERARVAGLNRARAEIIIAGGQLLEALMETLEVEQLTVCDWALREGVVIAHLTKRGATVTSTATRLERDPSLRGALALAAHYRADLKHAHRVAYLAQQLFDDLRSLHMLGGEHRRLLMAAAVLHDIGYLVSHTDHHKHSAYLIDNSELTGFTASEVAIIANVARYHRSTLPKPKHSYFAKLPAETRAVVRKLAAILRIADALDRDHEGRVRGVRAELDAKTARIFAISTRPSETTLWRMEERADLFEQEFGRRVELIAETNANATDG
ncbi:MAG: Ppx/GppA family phosphatase [Acidobacteria bacterium]|nr:Ppx/GppA family phosphatase [Acidobacteriota bacterium]MBI3426949.1 Ppx/GppA family phosphatase [Acidobacteriota bacterium]